MFTFDRDYKNLAQVEEFLPAFLVVYAELVGLRGFVYNDAFRGRVAGIVMEPGHVHRQPACGCSEDTAIYLLQKLKRRRDLEALVAARLAAGYLALENLVGVTRFAVVVHYHLETSGWREWKDVRVIPDAEGRPWGLLERGARSKGPRLIGGHVIGLPA